MANSNKEWNSIAMGAGSGDSGSGASSLVDLLDVEVLNPTDGQMLTYDATAQKWINGGGGSAGGVMVVNATSHYDEEHDETYYSADKSFDDVASFIENGGIPILINEFGRVVQCNTIERDGLGNIARIIFVDIYMDEDAITRSEYTYYEPNPLFPTQNFIGYNEVSYDGSGGGGDQ